MVTEPNGTHMAAESESNTERKRVQTYVPAYQREEWERRAESMDMSLSEFVRTMTQAGKRGFDETVEAGKEDGASTPSSGAEPQGSRLEDRVLSALPADEYLDWDELVAAVQEEFEAELGESIDDLLERGEVEHRHGRGYALA